MTDLAVSPAAPAAAPAAALMSAPPTSTPAPPLTISPDFLRLLGKSEQEVRIELAIFFYKEYQISPGKAGAIAGLSRIEFWEELGKRKIPINYDVEDLMHDVETLRQLDQKFPAKGLQQILGKSEAEMNLELAIFFFTSHYLSTGQAARFAGMSRVEFWEELGKRKISIFDYEEASLHEEVESLRNFKAKTQLTAA